MLRAKPQGMVYAIHKKRDIMMQQTIQPPLFFSKVSAGFPSPAEDYKDKPLCLNEHLVERPAATPLSALLTMAWSAMTITPAVW